MPVRTSAVVAGGLALLTIIGVTSIFGDTLLAMVAPPRTEGFSSTAETAARTATGGGQNATTQSGAAPPALLSPSRPTLSPAAPDGGSPKTSNKTATRDDGPP